MHANVCFITLKLRNEWPKVKTLKTMVFISFRYA
jgi:hypothetical protein